ncbi:hypothetical protein ES703_11059 [subsurface metagenome]|nr:T9SS type A sorting domain-containing protein [bacterium]
MRKTLMIFGVLALAAVPLFAQWHSDTRISNTSGTSYAPYNTGGWGVAADANDVYIVWRDYSFSQYVRAVVFPIGSPPAAGSGTALSSTSLSYDVAVAAGDGTNAHAVWDRSGNLYYNGYNGSSWGSQYLHTSGQSLRAQSITNTSNGTSYIATSGSWSYPGFVYRVCYRERSSGGTWGPLINAWAPSSSDYHYFVHPSICVTPDGVRHISMGIYRSAGPSYSIGHMWSSNGTSWSHEYLLPSYSAYHIRPTSICSDPDGNLYIAYMDYPSPYQVSVIDNVGGSWNTPVQISNCPTSLYYLSICCDTFGTVWVAWEDRSGTNYEIYYATRPAGGSWGAPQELTPNDGIVSRYPNLTADPNGNVHITWTDQRDGNYEVYYNWYAGSGGGPEPGARDLACTRILKPLGKITTDPVTPSAVIANFGGDVDSGYAMCVITGPGVNYDKGNLEGIVYLEAGEEDAVSFPSWTPPGGAGDRYRVEVTVYLWPERTTEDDNPTNNTQVEYATIESAVQVDPIEVAKPEEGSVVDSMTPKATFKNVGAEAAENFYCYCEIVSLGYHTVDYLDSVPVANLDPEETTNITFTQWVCDDDASYIATFLAAIPGSPDRTLLGIEWPVGFQGTPLVGVAESADALRIEVTGPNPFIAGTLVSYAVGYPISTTIRVYDVTGKVVRTLHDGELSGYGSVYWNGTDDAGAELAGGLYFIRIITPGFTKTAKVVLLH